MTNDTSLESSCALLLESAKKFANLPENFNSLRPILFELCKKNYRGGQMDPPPAGIGLTTLTAAITG